MLNYPGQKKHPDLLALIANVAGIPSLVFAVANGNLERLSSLQKWGLAIAAATMLWAFLMTAIVKYSVFESQNGRSGMAFAIIFFGGIIGAAMLLAIPILWTWLKYRISGNYKYVGGRIIFRSHYISVDSISHIYVV